MSGAVLSGYRHELQLYPPKIAGHLRAIAWAAIAAGFIWGIGL